MRYMAGESTKLHARRHNFGLTAGTWEIFSGKNKEPIDNRRKATLSYTEKS